MDDALTGVRSVHLIRRGGYWTGAVTLRGDTLTSTHGLVHYRDRVTSFGAALALGVERAEAGNRDQLKLRLVTPAKEAR